MHCVSHAWKQPRLQDFLNQDKNKGKPNFQIQIVKQENKNTTHVKQNFNKILLQKRNKNRTSLWQENVPQINVKYNRGNGEFYLYLYPLGI